MSPSPIRQCLKMMMSEIDKLQKSKSALLEEECFWMLYTNILKKCNLDAQEFSAVTNNNFSHWPTYKNETLGSYINSLLYACRDFEESKIAAKYGLG